MTASKQEPKKIQFDDLVYASGRWEIYRQDAGMGEKDYCVLRNGDFFCRTEQEQLAKDICAAYDKSRSHSSQPVPDSTTLIQMAETEWHNREERRGIHAMVPWTCGWMSGYLTSEGDIVQARKAEREQVLVKLREFVQNLSCLNEKCCRTIFGEKLESLRQQEERR